VRPAGLTHQAGAVVLEVPDEHGEIIQYVTATEAPAYFSRRVGVTKGTVATWHKNREITGYRIGREVYFRLSELQDVEYAKRMTRGGRPRRGLDQGGRQG
jgi:hypothetical protein